MRCNVWWLVTLSWSAAGCSALSPFSADGGPNVGQTDAGTGADAGNADTDAGGAGTDAGAGGVDAGGMDAGAGSDAGTDGGGSPLATWPWTSVDGGFSVQALRPTRAAQPQLYNGVMTRPTSDGGFRLWTADSFGDVYSFDGTQWAGLADTPSGLDWVVSTDRLMVSASSDVLLSCTGTCATVQTQSSPTGFIPVGGCARGDVAYLVGRDNTNHAALLRFDGQWSSLEPTSLMGYELAGCALEADGTLALVGSGLWRRSPQGELVQEVLEPPEVGMVFEGVIEVDGELLAYGRGLRVAHRLPSGTWRTVASLASLSTGPLFRTAARLPLGDVLFLGFADSALSANGSLVLLRLSFARQTWALTTGPSTFSAFGLAPITDDLLVLGGGHRQSSGSTEGAVLLLSW